MGGSWREAAASRAAINGTRRTSSSNTRPTPTSETGADDRVPTKGHIAPDVTTTLAADDVQASRRQVAVLSLRLAGASVSRSPGRHARSSSSATVFLTSTEMPAPVRARPPVAACLRRAGRVCPNGPACGDVVMRVATSRCTRPTPSGGWAHRADGIPRAVQIALPVATSRRCLPFGRRHRQGETSWPIRSTHNPRHSSWTRPCW
jgi:hypothetical protein